jgi:hypothetical protein
MITKPKNALTVDGILKYHISKYSDDYMCFIYDIDYTPITKIIINKIDNIRYVEFISEINGTPLRIKEIRELLSVMNKRLYVLIKNSEIVNYSNSFKYNTERDSVIFSCNDD